MRGSWLIARDMKAQKLKLKTKNHRVKFKSGVDGLIPGPLADGGANCTGTGGQAGQVWGWRMVFLGREGLYVTVRGMP
jgi:hypothetical protein